MLKMLRYDFYKIFKSKALLGVFVASVILSFVDALTLWLSRNEVTCVFLVLNFCTIVPFLPYVFVVPFACKDFSSKFTKNFYSEYSRKDRICYVLSKVVYIFAANVIWHAVYFASYCALIYLRCSIQHVPFMFEAVNYDGSVYRSVSEGTLSYFCVFVNAFAIEMLILFLSLLMKKEYFLLVVVVLYWLALSFPIYSALNKAMGLSDIFHTVEWFTLFGLKNRLSSVFFVPDPNGEGLVMAGFTQSLLVCLGYAVLFILLSCVVVSAKRTSVTRQTINEDSTTCLN